MNNYVNIHLFSFKIIETNPPTKAQKTSPQKIMSIDHISCKMSSGNKFIVHKSSEDEYLDIELWTIPDLSLKTSKYKIEDPAFKFYKINILYAWSPDEKLILSESGVMLDVESMEIIELPFNFRPFFLFWIP